MIQKELPADEIDHDVAEDDCKCPHCGGSEFGELKRDECVIITKSYDHLCEIWSENWVENENSHNTNGRELFEVSSEP